jgi:hypothetical protein
MSNEFSDLFVCAVKAGIAVGAFFVLAFGPLFIMLELGHLAGLF